MNPWRGLGSLPREIWVLFTVTLINRAGTMALPFLVLYLTRSLGFSPGRAGLTLTTYGIGALLTAPLSGHLSDRIGALRIMKFSLFLSGITLFIFPLAKSHSAILVLAFFWAIINEGFRPASMATISGLVRPEQRKSAFAVNRLAVNLGMSIGPALGGVLATVSFPALFIFDGTTSLIAGIFLALLPWRSKAKAEVSANSGETDKQVQIKSRGAFRDLRLLYFLAGIIPVQMVFFQTNASMPLFLVGELQMPESVYGMLFTINTVLIILIEVPLNTMMAAWSHRLSMALGALLCGAGFGALIFTPSTLGVAATVVVWTFGEMILFPGGSAYVADIAPEHRQGEYMGLYVMTFAIAFALGPWIGTEVYGRFGASVLWAGALACGILSALLLGTASSANQPKTAQSGSAGAGEA